MVPPPPAPNRLILDADALVGNWRWLRERGGSADCGACVKADGYGLGAVEITRRLAAAGCRDFYVSTWGEAAALPRLEGMALSVFHGVQPGEEDYAAAHWARPVLCSAEQVARWRSVGRPCDVMVDTGMNRLGVSPGEVRDGLLDGLAIDTLMSHLSSADQDTPTNERQRSAFAALVGRTSARRMSLANSAGVLRGRDYAFDLTRPGLSLYGGQPTAAATGIRPVLAIEARVVQRRVVRAGETVGYNALWRAERNTEVAILNLGYADGFPRALSNRAVSSPTEGLPSGPLVGRVSMDLAVLDVSANSEMAEGDWATLALPLAATAQALGSSQYELLTGLGGRFERVWR